MKRITFIYSALITLFLTFGLSLNAHAGTPKPASFGDFVWSDLDSDGVQDGGEAGIANILVTVCAATSGTSVDCTFTNTATTDINGLYTLDVNWFTPFGGYLVSVDVPSGFTATTPIELYFDNISGGLSGQSITTADFGIRAVPVPAAVWLFGSGLLGLVGVARRKQRC